MRLVASTFNPGRYQEFGDGRRGVGQVLEVVQHQQQVL